MQVLHYILNTLNSIPADAWGIVISTLVSAVIASPVVMAVKKWFSIDGEKKMVGLTIVASMLGSAVAYLHSVPAFAPWFVFVQGMLVFATTQPVYYFFVKPLSKQLGEYFAAQLAKVATATEAKAAAVPAAGLPLTSTPEVISDFSH